jgi:uncharacterized protein YndB with AHSA1/START domain
MWTDPKHIVEWWGPRGVLTENVARDVRPGDDGGEVRFNVTVAFDDVDGKTGPTMRQLFETGVERDCVVEKCRADKGGAQTLDRLAEHLAEMLS